MNELYCRFSTISISNTVQYFLFDSQILVKNSICLEKFEYTDETSTLCWSYSCYTPSVLANVRYYGTSPNFEHYHTSYFISLSFYGLDLSRIFSSFFYSFFLNKLEYTTVKSYVFRPSFFAFSFSTFRSFYDIFFLLKTPLRSLGIKKVMKWYHSICSEPPKLNRIFGELQFFYHWKHLCTV